MSLPKNTILLNRTPQIGDLIYNTDQKQVQRVISTVKMKQTNILSTSYDSLSGFCHIKKAMLENYLIVEFFNPDPIESSNESKDIKFQIGDIITKDDWKDNYTILDINTTHIWLTDKPKTNIFCYTLNNDFKLADTKHKTLINADELMLFIKEHETFLKADRMSHSIISSSIVINKIKSLIKSRKYVHQ